MTSDFDTIDQNPTEGVLSASQNFWLQLTIKTDPTTVNGILTPGKILGIVTFQNIIYGASSDVSGSLEDYLGVGHVILA